MIQDPNNAIFFRDENGLLAYSFQGRSYPVNLHGDTFKIPFKISGLTNNTDYQITFIQTADGIPTFIIRTASRVTAVGGGGGKNKIGGGSSVGNGTLNFIAKFTPDGMHIGNSLLYDNGLSIGFGTTSPDASATFDINSTTQGILLPRMTTVQRDAIAAPTDGLLIFNTTTELFSYWDATAGVWQNIDSQAGGDVSGSGTTNFITKWTDGPNSVIGNSIVFDDGTNVGIGINPANSKLQVAGAIRTGVASTINGSLIFQNSTNANTLTVNAGVFGANITWTLPTAQGGASTFLQNDGAGNLSWGTVVLTNFYQNGGNAFGGNATIGLTDNFNWSFLTNNIVRGLIDNGGLWAIGSSSTTAGSRLTITGTGTTNATYSIRTFNSTPTEIFSVRDDGYIYAGTSNNSLTIGANSGFVGTSNNNTFVGVGVATGVFTAATENNSGFGQFVLHALTSGSANTANGSGSMLSNTTGSFNSAFGFGSLASNTTGVFNTAIGYNAMTAQNIAAGGYNVGIGARTLLFNNSGEANVAVGVDALMSSPGGNNTAVGYSAMRNSGAGSGNTAIGREAGYTNAGSNNVFLGFASGNTGTGSNNVFLGFASGYYETGSNKLFIDNAPRASEADARNKALLYGKFDAAVANQFVVLNGILYMQDTAAPNHYWSIVNTAGVFVFTDTGSANAPA